MADQLPPNNHTTSDEIDLGQLMDLIKKGIKSFGNFFLRIFIYLRKNILKLGGLVILGIAISYGLNQIITKQLKTDVIVRPNFESKNYLYDVVEELTANIASGNEDFFKEIDISVADLKGFKIEVQAIEEEEVQTEEAVLNEMKYLEILQNFKDQDLVADILRNELSEKSVIYHKITFIYKDQTTGPAVVEKMMSYINNNEYYDGLMKVFAENATSRIEKNIVLIDQIDKLVDNYSKGLLQEKQESGTDVIYMEKENLNVPSLLSFKNGLLKDIENKRLEVAKQKGVLSILNFGKTHEVSKSFFRETTFLIPTILVLGFILLSFFKYLEQKAKEIE